MKQSFETFLSQLKETNVDLAFYSDFDKIANKVAEIEISLNSLNYLLGKTDLRAAVEALWARDPQAFDVMDILIATRKDEGKKYLDAAQNCHIIHDLFSSVDGVMEFLTETGLAEVFTEKKVKNLVDFVFGVETGMDTNARKNRSGQITEKLIADILKQAGISFEEQVSSRNYPELHEVLGADHKVFDFVIEADKVYLIEVNFYSGGGSKLNETARSYTELAPKVNSVDGFEFVWITDGIGWHSAKNKLEEAYNTIPSVYNLTTIGDFLKQLK